VRQYWSATAYEGRTHALIKNVNQASCVSNRGVKKNADGSVDIYFAAQASADKESNWVPTDPNGKFEVLFRFYGPDKRLFDKTWMLPDIEQTKNTDKRPAVMSRTPACTFAFLVTTIGTLPVYAESTEYVPVIGSTSVAPQ
jgi:hypothetical protein